MILSLLLLFGCSSHQARRGERPDSGRDQALAAPDSLQRAYELELVRNWSFGFENYKNRRYGEVPHFFWRVIAMDSARSFADVYSLLANAYLQLGRPDSARLVYEIGIDTLPGNPHLYRGLAALLSSQDEIAAAIAQYERVIALDAASEDDYLHLSHLYVAVGDTAKAIGTLAKLQELAPQDLAVRRELSALDGGADNHGEVDWRILESTLQQSPNDTRTLLALGKAYYHLQEYEKCASVLARYVELVPDETYAREYLGGAYVGLHKYSEAIAEFAVIIARYPGHANVLLQKANCHLRLQEWSTARRFAHRALAVDGNAGLAHLTLGDIYEAAARACVAAKHSAVDFSDKLVFQLAFDEFEKALLDPRCKPDARERMTIVAPFLPRPEEYFVNRNQDRPQGECYGWIYK